MRSNGEGGRATGWHVSTTKRHSRTGQRRFRLSRTRWDLQPHLFLCTGPTWLESLWRQLRATFFESGFPCSFLCPPEHKGDVLCKCFPSPMFWLFSLPCPQCSVLLRNIAEPTKHHFLSTGYEIISSDEWAE